MKSHTQMRCGATALWLLAITLSRAGFASAACPVRSNYDITVTPAALVFDHTTKPARRIEMHGGGLSDGGKAIALSAADRDRVLRFERGARNLLPRVRALGVRAVDLMAAAVREEAAATSPASATNPQLNARLEARVTDLKARIAKSNTSKDWRGNAFNGYATAALADVIPLVGGDLAQQALDATMRGEFSRAAALGEQAANVRTSLERRARVKLQGLQPEVDKLCPALRALDALEAGVTAPLADGRRLDLLQVGS